jgi:hypothetical protein
LPELRRDFLASLAILGAVTALVAGRPLARRLARHPTRERCAQMLDRYAAQEARQRDRAAPEARVSLDAPEVARCARDLTDEEVECALKSGYADELERCLP